MSDAPRSTMRRDIASAYLVTASRIGAWAVISGIAYRQLGPEPFALLTLVRATVGLLNYTSLGLGPALVRLLNEPQPPFAQPVIPLQESPAISEEPAAAPTLQYANAPAPNVDEYIARIYATAESLAIVLG